MFHQCIFFVEWSQLVSQWDNESFSPSVAAVVSHRLCCSSARSVFLCWLRVNLISWLVCHCTLVLPTSPMGRSHTWVKKHTHTHTHTHTDTHAQMHTSLHVWTNNQSLQTERIQTPATGTYTKMWTFRQQNVMKCSHTHTHTHARAHKQTHIETQRYPLSSQVHLNGPYLGCWTSSVIICTPKPVSNHSVYRWNISLVCVCVCVCVFELTVMFPVMSLFLFELYCLQSSGFVSEIFDVHFGAQTLLYLDLHPSLGMGDTAKKPVMIRNFQIGRYR